MEAAWRLSQAYSNTIDSDAKIVSNDAFELLLQSAKRKGTKTLLLERYTKGDCALIDGQTRELIKVLKKSTSITHLSVNCRDFDFVAASFADLINTKPYVSLGLSRSALGPESIRCLGESLRVNQSITELELTRCKMGPEGVYGLCCALSSNETLKRLCLDSNRLEERGSVGICEMLLVNKTLSRLELNNCFFQASSLSVALRRNATLRHLELVVGWNAFDRVEIIQALKVNRGLYLLDLGGSLIGEEEAVTLSEVLSVNSTLRELRLRNSKISSASASIIFKGLSSNSTMTKLDLCCNLIGSEGCKVIADVLIQNTVLKSLDLSWNCLSVEGGRLLGESLKGNRFLTDLGLGDCSLRDDGVRYICEALKVNDTISRLSLASNEFGPATTLDIANMLKLNKNIFELNLYGNTKSGKEIVDALKQSTRICYFQGYAGVEPTCSRNRTKHFGRQKSVQVFLAMRKFKRTVLNIHPREIIASIGWFMWRNYI